MLYLVIELLYYFKAPTMAISDRGHMKVKYICLVTSAGEVNLTLRPTIHFAFLSFLSSTKKKIRCSRP